MELGMIGLGKMGANMAERLITAGHDVVGFDLNRDAVADVIARGGRGADSLDDLMEQLYAPRAVWIMVPHGDPVDATLAALLPAAQPGDTFIDGGNSYYRETLHRADICREGGTHFVDVGTSGGIWGLTEGYSMMIGGDKGAVDRVAPLFQTLAPSPTEGWRHVGPSGAGHFVKMIHNGIEYGDMQVIAEAYDLMHRRTGRLPGTPKVPFTLGLDVVGTVDKIGAGVSTVELADRLAAGPLETFGGYSEFICLPADQLVPVPDGVDWITYIQEADCRMIVHRTVIDQAASLIDRPQLCLSMVVKTDASHNPQLAGLYIGSPQEAYAAAADLSSRLHIVWVDRPYQRVLSVMPEMYDDIWTAAKGMYKMEPAIADGGEVIIYAPHLDVVSHVHGKYIYQIGYHILPHFLQYPTRQKGPGQMLLQE